MKKHDLFSIIEEICPSSLAEGWDNSGVQINTSVDDVGVILVSLDITDEVIDEARSLRADLIITHHPLLFTPLKKIDTNSPVGRYIQKLILNGTSVYSCHTSFDRMNGGNNDEIGRLLEIEDVRSFNDDKIMGRRGELSNDMRLGGLIAYISEKLQIDIAKIKGVGDPDRFLRSIAWCSGAGADYIEKIAEMGLDVFVTGDVKYHDAMVAKERGLVLIDCGHYGTEKSFAANMTRMLNAKLSESGVCAICSEIDTDPFV